MLVDDAQLRRLLSEARTIAVVGLSEKPERDSNDVARYLQGAGYRVVPVNPALTRVLGEPAYPSVAAIPPEVRVDIVDIFRRSDQVPPVVAEAVARGVGAVWMQLGVQHEEAARMARDAGIPVLQNRCIKIEHHRLAIAGRTGSSHAPPPGPA